MRNIDGDYASKKCFFCALPVGSDHVRWTDQNAILRSNRTGKELKPKDDIFLCPDCAIKLGQRLMVDGIQHYVLTFQASLEILKYELRSFMEKRRKG